MRAFFMNSPLLGQKRLHSKTFPVYIQEPLSNQSSIEKELGQKLVEVTELLADLDITVGFLMSVGGDPNASLIQFMTDTLHMKCRLQLANVVCEFPYFIVEW